MNRSTISVLLSTPSLTSILMLIVMCSNPAGAQTIHDMTSEFTVSGSSSFYAGAMGTSPVAVDGQSRILVAWHKAPVPGGGINSSNKINTWLEFQRGIFVSTYSQTGVQTRETIQVDEPDSETWPMGPAIAADAQGRFVVVWRQARKFKKDSDRLIWSIWMRGFDSDGVPLTDAEQLTYISDALPSIDMAPNGEFVIVLGRTAVDYNVSPSTEEPQFLSFNANFQPMNVIPHLVDTALDTEPYSLISAVSLNEQGELAVAYLDAQIYSWYRLRKLRIRTLTLDGKAISAPIEIESSTVWGMNVEWLDSNYFVAAWMDGGRYAPIAGKWQVFNRKGIAASQVFSSTLPLEAGGILKLSSTEFATAWTTADGPVLIKSTLNHQDPAIPLNIQNEVLKDSFISYSVGDGYSEPSLPLSVASVEGDIFIATWMYEIDRREQVRAGIFKFKRHSDMANIEAMIEGPCVEDRLAKVRISWSSNLDKARIHVTGPSGDKMFAVGSGNGERLTGLWVRHGMAFKLINPLTNNVLATTKVNPGPDTCPVSPAVADPIVIEVCTPKELTSTEILWDVTSISPGGVDIRVNKINGNLFARGGKLGSFKTGKWNRNNTVYYLLRPYTTELLGTASSKYKQVACP